MALTLDQYREQNPEYSRVSNDALAHHLHDTYYSAMPFDEYASKVGYTPPAPIEVAKPIDPNADGDTVRGFKDSFTQTKQLGAGLLAGAGAAAETVFGEGGYASGIKKAGVNAYREIGKELEAEAKPSDSLTYSLDEAKAGNLGAFVDWAQHGIGNAIGQGVQGLATFGVGNFAGQQAFKLAGKEFIEGVVAKEAGEIVAKQEAAKIAATESGIAVGEVLSGEALTAQATANVASKFANIGGQAFVGGQAFGMEAGEVGGVLADKSVKEGRALTGEEAAKGFGWALAAGTVEFGGEMLGINAVLGKSKFLNKAMGIADSTPGISGRLARGAVAGAALDPVEGMQEGVQTVMEHYGEGDKDPFNEAGMKDINDSIGQGMLSGHTMGFIGGIAKAATVDDAIKAAGESINNPGQDIIPPSSDLTPPPGQLAIGYQQKLGNSGTPQMPSDTITFNDGSQIDAHTFFNDRKSEHGDDDLARQETYSALNGYPKPVLGLPHLIATSSGDLINRKETHDGFISAGYTPEQADSYIKSIVETPVEDRSIESYNSTMADINKKNQLPLPITDISNDEKSADDAIAANDITLNQPALAVKTGIGTLTEFELKRNQAQRDAENLTATGDLRKESELSTLNGTLDEQRKALSQQRRLDVLDPILADDTIEHKQPAFEAELKRQGFTNIDLTPFETAHLGQHINGLLSAEEVANQQAEADRLALERSTVKQHPDDNQEDYYDPNKVSAKKSSGEPTSADVQSLDITPIPISLSAKVSSQAGEHSVDTIGVSSPALAVDDAVSHPVKGNGVISTLISPKHAVVKWDDGSSSRAKIKSLTKTEEPVANEDNNADTTTFSSENYSPKADIINLDKQRTVEHIKENLGGDFNFLTHQTHSATAKEIMDSGHAFVNGAGTNGTTLLGNHETVKDQLDNVTGHGNNRHKGSDGLVVMAVPKSWGKKHDDIDYMLGDKLLEGDRSFAHPSRGGFGVPNKYIIGVWSGGKFHHNPNFIKNSEEEAKTEPVVENKKRTIAEISRDNHLAKPKNTKAYGATTKKEFVEKAVADGYKPVTEIDYDKLDKDRATLNSHDAPANPLYLPPQEAKALREKLSNEDNYKTIHTLAKDKEDGSTSSYDVSKHEYKHAESLLKRPEDVLASDKDNSPGHNQRVADMETELRSKQDARTRAEFTKKHGESPFAHSLINNDHEKANDDIYRGKVSKEDAKKILDDAKSTGLINEVTAKKVSDEIDSKDTINKPASEQNTTENVKIDLNKDDKDGIQITEADIAAFMKKTNDGNSESISLADQLKSVREDLAAYEQFKNCLISK